MTFATVRDTGLECNVCQDMIFARFLRHESSLKIELAQQFSLLTGISPNSRLTRPCQPLALHQIGAVRSPWIGLRCHEQGSWKLPRHAIGMSHLYQAGEARRHARFGRLVRFRHIRPDRQRSDRSIEALPAFEPPLRSTESVSSVPQPSHSSKASLILTSRLPDFFGTDDHASASSLAF
jgi:hypothetical protein